MRAPPGCFSKSRPGAVRDTLSRFNEGKHQNTLEQNEEKMANNKKPLR